MCKKVYTPENVRDGNSATVPGSLDKKGSRRCHLLLNKIWNLPQSFLFNEPGTALPKIRSSGVLIYHDPFANLIQKVK
jgi:hypothetical protein